MQKHFPQTTYDKYITAQIHEKKMHLFICIVFIHCVSCLIIIHNNNELIHLLGLEAAEDNNATLLCDRDLVPC